MEYGEKKIPGGTIVGLWEDKSVKEETKPVAEVKKEVEEAPRRRRTTTKNA